MFETVITQKDGSESCQKYETEREACEARDSARKLGFGLVRVFGIAELAEPHLPNAGIDGLELVVVEETNTSARIPSSL